MERYEIAIEIIDGAFSASSWQQAYGDSLTNAAMSWSGLDWEWRQFTWGLLFMVAFPSEEEYDAWRAMPAVIAALDAIPDRIVFHRGWGGTAGGREPRKPRPIVGAGSAEIPLPDEPVELIIEAVGEGAEPTERPLRTAAVV